MALAPIYSGATWWPCGNSASRKPVPGGYCITRLPDGSSVWQTGMAGSLHAIGWISFTAVSKKRSSSRA